MAKEIKRKIIAPPVQEIAVINYPFDLTKELEFIKKIDFDEQGTPEDPRIQTSIDKFILWRPELKKIHKFLQEQLDYYVENVLGSRVKLLIQSSWVAKQVSGSRTEPHVHQSIIDGCFYLNVPDKKTPLALDTYNCLGVREDFFIEIGNGDLVLWDNKLSHWVPQNNNKETRYSLAFNTSNKEQFDFTLELANAYNNPNSNVKKVTNKYGTVRGEDTETNIDVIMTQKRTTLRNKLNKKN